MSAPYSEPKPEQSNLPVSELFGRVDADIIFRSHDNTLFNIHRTNLVHGTCIEMLIPAAFNSKSEIIVLPEHSTTLELLFQFIYPARHPYLESIRFEVLSDLADAVEKYQVYSAINICKIRMAGASSVYAADVMAYALKHGYSDIVSRFTPVLLERPLEEAVGRLPSYAILPWVKYYGKWVECIQKASLHSAVVLEEGITEEQWDQDEELVISNVCRVCSTPVESFVAKVLGELIAGGVTSLKRYNALGFEFLCCDNMRPAMLAWRLKVGEDIKSIPEFSAFL